MSLITCSENRVNGYDTSACPEKGALADSNLSVAASTWVVVMSLLEP